MFQTGRGAQCDLKSLIWKAYHKTTGYCNIDSCRTRAQEKKYAILSHLRMIGWPWWHIIRVNFLNSVSPTEAFWVTCRDRAERKPTITFKVWLAKQFPWNINPPFTLRWAPASTGKPGSGAGYRWHVCGCRPARLQLWTELMQDVPTPRAPARDVHTRPETHNLSELCSWAEWK